jgi:hypothetical protein
MLINVAILRDINVIMKKAKKIQKYKDLTIGTQSMWNVETVIITVIIRETKTTSKSFKKYLGNTPGEPENTELCKTAILGTAHILRKVLM